MPPGRLLHMPPWARFWLASQLLLLPGVDKLGVLSRAWLSSCAGSMHRVSSNPLHVATQPAVRRAQWPAVTIAQHEQQP